MEMPNHLEVSRIFAASVFISTICSVESGSLSELVFINELSVAKSVK